MVLVCSKCNKFNMSENKICIYCGAQLEENPGTVELKSFAGSVAELKTKTAMDLCEETKSDTSKLKGSLVSAKSFEEEKNDTPKIKISTASAIDTEKDEKTEIAKECDNSETESVSSAKCDAGNPFLKKGSDDELMGVDDGITEKQTEDIGDGDINTALGSMSEAAEIKRDSNSVLKINMGGVSQGGATAFDKGVSQGNGNDGLVDNSQMHIALDTELDLDTMVASEPEIEVRLSKKERISYRNTALLAIILAVLVDAIVVVCLVICFKGVASKVVNTDSKQSCVGYEQQIKQADKIEMDGKGVGFSDADIRLG